MRIHGASGQYEALEEDGCSEGDSSPSGMFMLISSSGEGGKYKLFHEKGLYFAAINMETGLSALKLNRKAFFTFLIDNIQHEHSNLKIVLTFLSSSLNKNQSSLNIF